VLCTQKCSGENLSTKKENHNHRKQKPLFPGMSERCPEAVEQHSQTLELELKLIAAWWLCIQEQSTIFTALLTQFHQHQSALQVAAVLSEEFPGNYINYTDIMTWFDVTSSSPPHSV
jgi:hypothetical protein